jgi:hypothetical protein
VAVGTWHWTRLVKSKSLLFHTLWYKLWLCAVRPYGRLFSQFEHASSSKWRGIRLLSASLPLGSARVPLVPSHTAFSFRYIYNPHWFLNILLKLFNCFQPTCSILHHIIFWIYLAWNWNLCNRSYACVLRGVEKTT